MADETVLAASFMHETNTFVEALTTRRTFQKRYEYFGSEIPASLGDTNTSLGGVIGVADRQGIDLIHTVAASAEPGGPVAQDAYEFYTDHITSAVRDHADALDGVIMALHGAMVPEHLDDGEGALVTEIREIVGDGTPVVVVLDLHANNTDQLFVAADAVVGYDTYPHVDMGETGRTAMELLLAIIRGELEPVTHVERPPLVPYGTEQNTRKLPMARVMAHARRLEGRDDIIEINVFPGFLQSDVPSMSVSISVIADGNERAARDAAQDLAELMWELRSDFVGEYVPPEAAVQQALDIRTNLDDNEDPILLAELGPVTGAGGAGDGTTLLRAMLDADMQDAGYATMCDPEAVEACTDAGVGNYVEVTIGGKTDDLHGRPIEGVPGYVKAITDGTFVNSGPIGRGQEQFMGRTVRLQCEGVDILLTELRYQPYDTEIWRHVGIQPEHLEYIAIASQNHFRADYEPIVNPEIILVDTPGLGIMDPTKYDYERVERPKFPIDEMDADEYPSWE